MSKQLWVEYETSSEGGESKNRDDVWSSHEDLIITFRPLDIFISTDNIESSWHREHIDIDFDYKVGDTVYLIVVRHSSGNTFGRSYGNYQFIGIFNDYDKAKKIEKFIDTHTKHDADSKVVQEYLSHLPYSPYPNWFGYFEGFECCELTEHVIKP